MSIVLGFILGLIGSEFIIIMMFHVLGVWPLSKFLSPKYITEPQLSHIKRACTGRVVLGALLLSGLFYVTGLNPEIRQSFLLVLVFFFTARYRRYFVNLTTFNTYKEHIEPYVDGGLLKTLDTWGVLGKGMGALPPHVSAHQKGYIMVAAVLLHVLRLATTIVYIGLVSIYIYEVLK